ncbi:MAG: AAA family ATPase [Anaerolineae bacterium]|jgi:pilus assembly protein CpaE
MDPIGGEPLRVLLISTDERTRDEVAEALTAGTADHRLYWVSQASNALSRAQDVVPHLVLVDHGLEGEDELAIIRQLVRSVPTAAVLALVEWDAMTRASQAVLAGARGFVMKPLQTSDLLTAIKQVMVKPTATAEPEERAREVRGRAVVFCAPKGGTGRTTLALNTAIALHQRTREPVALVDADYAAPALDVALNLPADRTINDLLPRLSQLDDDLVSGVMVSHVSGVQVLLAPPPEGVASPIPLQQVQQIMVALKRIYPWVLVDLGLPMDETAYAFLDDADRIVMSVLPEMVGLRNTRLMLSQLHGRGYPDERVWLVLNRSSLPGGVSRKSIEERLGVDIRNEIPDDQALATHAVNRGVPIMMGGTRGAVAKAMAKLAEELVRDLRPRALRSEEAGADEGGSLLRRLIPRRSDER